MAATPPEPQLETDSTHVTTTTLHPSRTVTLTPTLWGIRSDFVFPPVGVILPACMGLIQNVIAKAINGMQNFCACLSNDAHIQVAVLPKPKTYPLTVQLSGQTVAVAFSAMIMIMTTSTHTPTSQHTLSKYRRHGLETHVIPSRIIEIPSTAAPPCTSRPPAPRRRAPPQRRRRAACGSPAPRVRGQQQVAHRVWGQQELPSGDVSKPPHWSVVAVAVAVAVVVVGLL
ncbi:hypothetical protein Pelo_18588 [Pelomyxa schiedti]|nr:hypothetical protein Pelo_18588 [Pelomyxa schiedti]